MYPFCLKCSSASSTLRNTLVAALSGVEEVGGHAARLVTCSVGAVKEFIETSQVDCDAAPVHLTTTSVPSRGPRYTISSGCGRPGPYVDDLV